MTLLNLTAALIRISIVFSETTAELASTPFSTLVVFASGTYGFAAKPSSVIHSVVPPPRPLCHTSLLSPALASLFFYTAFLFL
jgi:hypothetical protein